MNDTTQSGPALFLSYIGTIFAWITLKDFQIILTIIATLVSITAGCLAARLYYLKIKSKKFE